MSKNAHNHIMVIKLAIEPVLENALGLTLVKIAPKEVQLPVQHSHIQALDNVSLSAHVDGLITAL